MGEYKEILDKEIEKRIELMEQEEDSFSKRFSKKNYWSVGVVVAICLLLIVFGTRV